MGSLNREPRPRSSERLTIKQIETVKPDPEGWRVDVTLTVSYEPWSDNKQGHELKDAVVAVYKALEGSRTRAEKKRLKRLNEEYKDIGI